MAAKRGFATIRFDIVAAVALAALVFFTGEPLWVDEMMQFVFGAYASTGEAWAWARLTSIGINHHQTGAYFMLDHWSLRLFGASTFALRWPTLVADLMLLLCAALVMRRWGLPFVWRLWGLCAVCAQHQLAARMGEARPYAMLAAGAVALLLFFSMPAAGRRTSSGRVLGLAGVLIGGIFHPYLPLYAVLAWGFGIFWNRTRGDRPQGVRGWVMSTEPAVWIPGAAAFIGLGAITWMRGTPEWHYDPWESTGRGLAFVSAFLATHFEWAGAGEGRLPALVACVAVAGLAVVLRAPRRAAALPALLLLLALGISLFVSWGSWRARYPIFLRQWTASLAIVPLACAWLAAITAPRLPRPAALGFALLLWAPVVWRTGVVVAARFQPVVVESGAGLDPARAPADTAGWVRLANANCARGGPVWPVFRAFYHLP